MSTGETVTTGSCLSFLHRIKRKSPIPGSGNAAGDLQELVGKIAEQSDTQKIIATILIHTPEYDQRDHKKCRFLTQPGDQQHELRQRWKSDPFQKMQKFHDLASLCQLVSV